MADLRISELPVLSQADAEANDDIAVADYSSSETRRLTVKGLVQQGVVNLIDDGVIPGAKVVIDSITATQIAPNAITDSELADDAVDTAAIQDAAVTSAKIATDTITAANIAPDAVTASELADNSVDTAAIIDSAVTAAKIATDTITSTQIAANAVTASELADSSVDTAAIIDGAVTSAKIATDTITATNIAASAVTASELADNAVDTNAIVDAAVTDIKLATGIDGAKLSADTVTAAKIPSASLDRGLDKTTGSIGHTNLVTAGTRSGITFDAQGHITSTAALVDTDLPVATTTTIGGVSVAADSGLAVSGTGEISIANTIAAATVSGISFDEYGSITGAVALVDTDLPLATTTTVGGIIVPASGNLEIDGAGNISIPDSGVVAGEYSKVTVNAKGIVTAATTLSAADIPDLSAAILTSGTLDAARLSANSIPGSKFSNSSVCQFGGSDSTAGVVTFPTAEYSGQFFFDSINSDLYIWDGNAWQPVTITSGEIIFAGTYDAGTNLVASVTTQGQAAGLTAGSALPAASADNRQYYLVVSELGTGTAPAPAVALNPPDILLSSGTDWELLDVSSFVAAQLASNISFVPFGDIQSTNVQTALQEVSTEKLAKSGGTMTGTLEIGNTGSLVFEGATNDDFELTIAITDPTADRTITFPDVSGTVITTGDTGTVTSTMISDGTIVNADINASASIAFSKLANLTSAYMLVGSASNVPTAVPITGDISISNAGAVAITAGAIVDADINAGATISASKIQAATTSNAGVVQLNNTINSTSATLAATANAVKTAYDLAALAMPKGGGTFTGAVTIGALGSLLFEGATDNDFETTLAVTDPTADRTIALPDSSGTVALTSQLDDGSY